MGAVPEDLICGLSVQHIVSRQWAANALECKIADWFNRYLLLDCHQDTRANQDLPGLGFITKPRCDIGNRSNGGIIKASFKADRAKRGKSVRDPNAEADVVSNFTPLRTQLSDRRSHINR